MSTLWIRIGEEVSLPGKLSSAEAARLAMAFEPAWREALRLFALRSSGGSLLRFVEGVPYFNASAMTETVSHGAVVPEPDGSNRGRNGLFATLKSLRTQWRVEAFLSRLPEVLPSGDAALLESVALGLALQLLLLRLPARSEEMLARWLADPAKAPAATRATLRKILRIQGRRTKLSGAWASLYGSTVREPLPETPAQFWDEPPANSAPAAATLEAGKTWKGIPICPGTVEGEAFIVPRNHGPGDISRGIMIFAQARPDAVELFPNASALVFAEGGALAHACCVAREQGIPCVSGMGREFFRQMQARSAGGSKLLLKVDGSEGEVTVGISE